MDSPKPRMRMNVPIALGVLGVVLVGAWVGTVAGRLAHRAPRATGMRVLVLPPDTSALPEARGLDRFIASVYDRALLRAFAGPGPERHVVPLSVATSKLEVMRRGGRDGTLKDAADVLDVDFVVAGRVAPEGDGLVVTLEVGPPLGPSKEVSVPVPGADPAEELVAALPQVLSALGSDAAAVPATAPVQVQAIAAYSQGRDLLDGGQTREAAARLNDAGSLDASFADAHAWAALAFWLERERTPQDDALLRASVAQAQALRDRLGPTELLLTDAIAAWLAWQSAPETERPLRGEEVFAALRALTVKHPEERVGHLLLGRAYVQIMNGPTEALRHLENARRLAPTWFPTVAELVDTWLKMGDRKHATAELRGYLVYRKEDQAARALLRALGE